MIGDSKVGKTNLINIFMNNGFNKNCENFSDWWPFVKELNISYDEYE